jgi:hypothetical protein
MAGQRRVYRVTLACPGDLLAVLDVPSCLGSEPAERRAWWTAVSLGWGDVDDITIVNVEQLQAATS